MKRILLVLLCGIFSFGLTACIANSGNNNKAAQKIVTEDMLEFKAQYEELNGQTNAAGRTYATLDLPEYNLIKFVTPQEILAIRNSGRGLIFFAFPTCPWCRQASPILVDLALEMKLDAINYIDMLEVRSLWEVQDGNAVKTRDGAPGYYELLESFSSILPDAFPHLHPFVVKDDDGNEYETGEQRIFVPLVVAIRDGEIVGYHGYTVPFNEGQTQWDALTDQQVADLSSIYRKLIEEVQLR